MDCVKFNIDAKYDSNNGKGFAGNIVRDSQGYLLTASSCRIFAISPLMAEALFLREAMVLASSLSVPKVMFESDNQILIEICRGNKQMGEIQAITKDIETLKLGFEHCGRDGNNVAHTIVDLVSKGELVGDWIRKRPGSQQSAIFIDMQGLWR